MPFLQKSSNDIRISIIHNPKSAEQSTEKSTLHAVQVALDTLPSLMAKSFITKLIKEDNVKALANGQKTYEDLAVNVSYSFYLSVNIQFEILV